MMMRCSHAGNDAQYAACQAAVAAAMTAVRPCSGAVPPAPWHQAQRQHADGATAPSGSCSLMRIRPVTRRRSRTTWCQGMQT
ncbi:hypothetical protein AVL59_16725 [Streptomyces griseochromogenes]|uniref:Uncharacterized protein n=1 Tax=Streptomyces griseochromogenes TaxID=68214 RepID=A0A1B1AWT8_9ACTN|nr:hypothetical protein AVL59_16725 [Streptomyces griseochromogenes]